MLTNPDMSKSKALLYIDTVVNYLSPRIVCGLGLAECSGAAVSEQEQERIQFYPNPVEDLLHVTLPHSTITEIVVVNMGGEVVSGRIELQGDHAILDLSHLNSAVYFVRVTSDQATYVEKIVIR